MAGVFVVDLPGMDMGMTSIALAQDLGDATAFLAVALVAEAVVAARAELAGAALGVDPQHVGVAFEHPAGRGGGGGAEHDLETGGAERVDGAVEPAEGQLAGAGLHA